MATTRFESDVFVAGNVSAQSVSLPSGTVTNEDIEGSAGISASKLEHRHEITFAQANTTAADETKIVHSVYGSTGEVIACKAGSIGVCGGDSTVSIDLVKCNTSGTTSVLTSAITLDSGNTAYALESGTIVSSGVEDLAAGDILKIVLDATAGTSSSLATGVFVSLVVNEDAS